jgi:NADH-quinone oxidoreductase subunit N
LLYGLALVFGLTGETRLGTTGTAMAALGPNHPAVVLALSLILGGFALRMGLLPVRWWPRGFEVGVPLRVIMFVQSAGVVVAFAVFARLVAGTFAGSRIPSAAIFAGVAAVAMTGGNLLAVMQSSVRRLLVYGGIAQAGFALAAFTDLKGLGLSALVIFLVGLALSTIGAFAAVIAYARHVHSDSTRHLAGMSRAAPGLAFAFAVAVVSLIGLPPLAGFFGKVLVLQAVVNSGYAWLAVVGAANIAFAAFGYLRLLKIAFVDPPVFEVAPARLDWGIQGAVVLASAGVVFMGLLLGPLDAAASYARAALLH